MYRRAFTVAEANALVPCLESALERIDDCKKKIRRHHDKMKVLDVLWGGDLLREENPDFAEAQEHRAQVLLNVRKIEQLLQAEILDRGLRFPQGGLQNGLVDFPTTWEGRWVYLCWHRGEPAVRAWHEVDAGFRGRQTITPEQERRMGLEDDPETLDDSLLDF